MNYIKVRLKAALKDTYKFLTHYYCYECKDYTVKLKSVNKDNLIFECKKCKTEY